MRAIALLLLALVPVVVDRPWMPAAEPLEWLAGCWRLSRGGSVVDEQWLRPLGGVMLGSSRTVRGGKTVEYELMVLRYTADGATYEAHPSGQAVATFTSRSAPTGAEIVFENPAHDFPQRVGYRRASADSVVAWISGPAGSSTRTIEFPYARAACAAP